MSYMKDIDKGFDAFDYLMEDILDILDGVYDKLDNAVNNVMVIDTLKEEVEDVMDDIVRLKLEIKRRSL